MRPYGVFVALVALLLVGWNPTELHAGSNDRAKIAAHLVSVSPEEEPCTGLQTLPSCDEGASALNVHGNLRENYYLYLLVMDADSSAGVAGAAFGITYNGQIRAGMDVTGWTLCADLEFSGGPSGIFWPRAGSGTVITWNGTSNCQHSVAPGELDGGVTAILGALRVYAWSNDEFAITPRLYVPYPDLAVSDCQAQVSDLSFPESAGRVGFGSGSGVDPCENPPMRLAPPRLAPPNPGTPPPPISEVPRSSWSSGFDPTQVDFEWPYRIILGPDKAVVSNNRLYLTGDEIVFSFPSQDSVLYMNGDVWVSYKRPQRKPSIGAPSAKEMWGKELFRRYSADQMGSPEERLRRVIDSMDKSILDPSFEPKVTGNQLEIQFKGEEDFEIVIMDPLPRDPPEIEAKKEVRSLVRSLEGLGPFAIVHYPTRGYIRSGDPAVEVLSVLKRAKSGSLTPSDLDVARRHFILEAVRSIEEASR